MKGLPDSVVVGTITNARRRAVQRQIAARRAGSVADRYANLTFMHYVGGTALMLAWGLVATLFIL
jgi:hypothetical protein